MQIVTAQLMMLQRLDGEPAEETAELRPVAQSGRRRVWRVSHPYRDGVAVRLIVWFPAAGHAVIALFAGDKAGIGDAFYSSVGTRADAAIDLWLQRTRQEKRP